VRNALRRTLSHPGAAGESASPYQSRGERYGRDTDFDGHGDRNASTWIRGSDTPVAYIMIYEFSSRNFCPRKSQRRLTWSLGSHDRPSHLVPKLGNCRHTSGEATTVLSEISWTEIFCAFGAANGVFNLVIGSHDRCSDLVLISFILGFYEVSFIICCPLGAASSSCIWFCTGRSNRRSRLVPK
jgi:hypothetical protein